MTNALTTKMFDKRWDVPNFFLLKKVSNQHLLKVFFNPKSEVFEWWKCSLEFTLMATCSECKVALIVFFLRVSGKILLKIMIDFDDCES